LRGTAIRCPSCGTTYALGSQTAVVARPEAAGPAFDCAVDITVGEVQALSSSISVTFHLDPRGSAYLQIATFSDHGRSTPYTVVRLDDDAYDELARVMGKADDLVKRFRNSGPNRRMSQR
jgi:hypothetical protein